MFHLGVAKIDWVLHMLQCAWETEETRAVPVRGLAAWATSGRHGQECANWSMSMEYRCTQRKQRKQSVTRASRREQGSPNASTNLRLVCIATVAALEWSGARHVVTWDSRHPESQTHHGNYLVHWAGELRSSSRGQNFVLSTQFALTRLCSLVLM
jgi:hypothetical protein